MAAFLIGDFFNAAQALPSIVGDPVASGVGPNPCSGAIIGAAVDMLLSDTYTSLFVAGGRTLSGLMRVGIQTSDATTSGSFTDPTSGLAALPGAFQSGGLLWINSGGGLFSGFLTGASFQRPHRYARAVVLSGDFYSAPMQIGFFAQLRTTGSGQGFTYSPSSGTINV